MKIIFTNILVKANYSIRLIEYYHGPFYQVYMMITAKILEIKLELAFQISFKVLKNLLKPNSFILTLLIFDIYPYMTKIDTFLLTITQRNITI